jgi:hypothetical protein
MHSPNHLPTVSPSTKAIPVQLDREKQSWWNSLSEKQRQAITSIAIVMGVSVASIILIKFIHNKYQDIRANQAERGSFVGNNKHDVWGKQLEMAFENDMIFGWGTKEELIRKVFIAIPSKEDFKKVQQSYENLTKGEILDTRLAKELRITEYREMQAIIDAKPLKAKDAGAVIYDPYNWAKRLYNAMSLYYLGIFPATDEDAIKAVFAEMPSKKAFEDTKVAYQAEYQASLEDDLDGDLYWTLDWRAIVQGLGRNS